MQYKCQLTCMNNKSHAIIKHVAAYIFQLISVDKIPLKIVDMRPFPVAQMY